MTLLTLDAFSPKYETFIRLPRSESDLAASEAAAEILLSRADYKTAVSIILRSLSALQSRVAGAKCAKVVARCPAGTVPLAWIEGNNRKKSISLLNFEDFFEFRATHKCVHFVESDLEQILQQDGFGTAEN